MTLLNYGVDSIAQLPFGLRSSLVSGGTDTAVHCHNLDLDSWFGTYPFSSNRTMSSVWPQRLEPSTTFSPNIYPAPDSPAFPALAIVAQPTSSYPQQLDNFRLSFTIEAEYNCSFFMPHIPSYCSFLPTSSA